MVANNQAKDAYNILIETQERFGGKIKRSLKDRVIYQRCRISACYRSEDMEKYLQENLELENILSESNENQKTLAKTCIVIAYIYHEKNDKDVEKCFEYLKKAEDIARMNGDEKMISIVEEKIKEIQDKEAKEEEKRKQQQESG